MPPKCESQKDIFFHLWCKKTRIYVLQCSVDEFDHSDTMDRPTDKQTDGRSDVGPQDNIAHNRAIA